jgi:tellurite resistance protein TehA-like permease
MGTGIVSTDFATDNLHDVSLVLLAVASIVWVALGLALTARTRADRSGVWNEAHLPAALTGVAATAVLGARATGLGWSGVAAALLVIATVLWLILLPLVLSRPSDSGAGVAFMSTVSTQSLAVLVAQLAVPMHASWLLYAGLTFLGLGLVLYGFVLARFDLRQLLVGRGDHWVSGGALAISTLAAARITLGARELHALAGAAGWLRGLTLVLWALSATWLPALIVAEAARPRLGYDLRRWATVFPVGMYAACSFEVGRASALPAIVRFADVWTWVALAVWLIVAAGTVLNFFSSS